MNKQGFIHPGSTLEAISRELSGLERASLQLSTVGGGILPDQTAKVLTVVLHQHAAGMHDESQSIYPGVLF